MSSEIIVALIGAAASVLAVILTNLSANKKIDQKMEVHLAVFDTQLKELTREVREHNNFARRMPVLEEKMERLERKEEKIEEKIER